MKLNLGCGFLKLKGYTNVDNQQICDPDLCFNLEDIWPLDENSVDEIVLHHTLEHLGQTIETFFQVMKEMYRVSKDEAVWKITVPHYNSDIFHIDPTHVRKIAPMTMRMFDQQDNVKDIINKGHYTKLGILHEIDIEVTKENFFLSEPWNTKAETKAISFDEINFAGSHYNNVCSEIYIECKVHKPQRYPFDKIRHLYD